MTKTSAAQIRATEKYQRSRSKALTVRFYPGTMDIYDHIKAQPCIAEYIGRLVREDMKVESRKSKVARVESRESRKSRKPRKSHKKSPPRVGGLFRYAESEVEVGSS